MGSLRTGSLVVSVAGVVPKGVYAVVVLWWPEDASLGVGGLLEIPVVQYTRTKIMPPKAHPKPRSPTPS